jgi:hypothetical protein
VIILFGYAASKPGRVSKTIPVRLQPAFEGVQVRKKTKLWEETDKILLLFIGIKTLFQPASEFPAKHRFSGLLSDLTPPWRHPDARSHHKLYFSHLYAGLTPYRRQTQKDTASISWTKPRFSPRFPASPLSQE